MGMSSCDGHLGSLISTSTALVALTNFTSIPFSGEGGDREREGGRECVCVCVRERERETSYP